MIRPWQCMPHHLSPNNNARCALQNTPGTHHEGGDEGGGLVDEHAHAAHLDADGHRDEPRVFGQAAACGDEEFMRGRGGLSVGSSLRFALLSQAHTHMQAHQQVS